MQVRHVDAYETLCSLREAWDRLAGLMPLRSWEWHAGWWRYYGNHKQLMVLVVEDASGEVVGIAPWFVERVPARGRVIRSLGSGEVCSDYQTILAAAGRESAVVEALSDWLIRVNQRGVNQRGANQQMAAKWDLLELENILADDPVQSLLCERLSAGGAQVHRSPALQCWRLALPADWETYLSQLSKSHRKQVRRFVNRVLDTDRAKLHTVQTADEVSPAMDTLIDLHQRRWQSQDEPGCFASPRFTAFHRHIALAMQKRGQLRLHWLELDGTPIAAEYHLSGPGDSPGSRMVYGYQAGVDPTRLDEEPGRLAAIATLRLAIEEGFTAFDFLRGDEPYKAHWRAEPSVACNVRVVPPRATARVRDGLWQAGRRMKAWLNTEAEIRQDTDVQEGPSTANPSS